MPGLQVSGARIPKTLDPRARIARGDFQTPDALAKQLCELLARRGVKPASVIEPNCGEGRFLAAALNCFPDVTQALGFDINDAYVACARQNIAGACGERIRAATRIERADFFATDWRGVLEALPEPLLIVGNPPWVTNSKLGELRQSNLPEKINASRQRGVEALTGASNFDISEWMISRLLESARQRRATLAMLCKAAVARKVLLSAWTKELPLTRCAFYRIDAREHFGVAVEAGFLVCECGPGETSRRCECFDAPNATRHADTIEFHAGQLRRTRPKALAAPEIRDTEPRTPNPEPGRWRSGIKHDCAKVMELTREGDAFRNGLDERVELEEICVYPLLKSSDLANGGAPRRWLLVPQRTVGEDTAALETRAPKTWRYLLSHADLLDRRASRIYRGRPRFSIFGVGPYTFAPWKVAISGLYKTLRFSIVGSVDSKPVVLDDTCYFVPCVSEEEAGAYARWMQSPQMRAFLDARIFWDNKRPITARILNEGQGIRSGDSC